MKSILLRDLLGVIPDGCFIKLVGFDEKPSNEYSCLLPYHGCEVEYVRPQWSPILMRCYFAIKCDGVSTCGAPSEGETDGGAGKWMAR